MGRLRQPDGAMSKCTLLREEPYRVFFPLGILAGIYGVMMWPMLYAGWLPFHPAEAHAHLMIEGFMGAFIIGFIGTAFPRLASHRIWYHGEWLAQIALWLLVVTSHARGQVAAGDAAFAALLTVVSISVISRWFHGRRDTPPPGFVLVLPALIAAAISAWLLSRPGLDARQIQWAKLWLYQALPLLPIMGITPYLLPRFFGHDSSHAFDDSASIPPGWWPKALRALTAGSLIVISFALETSGHASAGHLLRALTVLLWFAIETPMLRKAAQPTTPATASRWAALSIIGAWIAAVVWPQARLGSMHLFFASGAALITLAVATRVVLGHAGRHDLLQGKIIWLRWVIGLLVLAATTRLSADLILKVQISHYIYAAWSWAIASALWLGFAARYLWRHEQPDKKPSNCPRRRHRINQTASSPTC